MTSQYTDAHHHGGVPADARRLRIVLAIALATAAIEVTGGLVTNSLALLADAGHVFADVGALSLALLAVRVAARAHTLTWTFGFHRAEVLAASLNALALLIIAALITWRVLARLNNPAEVDGVGLIAVAIAGLVANMVMLRLLQGSTSVNMHAARLHVFSDLGGSLAAVGAGTITTFTDWNRADPLLSLVIVALVVFGAIRLLRQTSNILMARVPSHVDLEELTYEIQALPSVIAAHDVHCWMITNSFVAFACHLQLIPGADVDNVLREASDMLRDRWGIDHVTIQPETLQLLTPEHEPPEGNSATGPYS